MKTLDVPVDWRSLFDSIKVDWKDKGPNCSRGKVNITCPFCPDDPSYHLTISEATGKYHCFRDPSHYGSAVYLVQRLLHSRVRAVHLVEEFTEANYTPPPKEYSKLAWAQFPNASESKPMRDYLWKRGFFEPEAICKLFDLRYAPEGQWARRLLFPLFNANNEVKSWTGRTIDDHAHRYKENVVPDLETLVSGDMSGKVFILVEGPIDALKINAFCEDTNISAVALCGSSLSPGQAELLKKRYPSAIWFCNDLLVHDRARKPDHALGGRLGAAAVLRAELAAQKTLAYLRMTCHSGRAGRIRLPEGAKDPGELSADAIKTWLGGLGNAKSQASAEADQNPI